MNNADLKRLDTLEAEAAQLAASFYSRALRADPGSDRHGQAIQKTGRQGQHQSGKTLSSQHSRLQSE